MPENLFLPIDVANNRVLNADEQTTRREITLQQGETYDFYLKFLSGGSVYVPEIDEFSFLVRDNPSAAEDILVGLPLQSGSGVYPYRFTLPVDGVPLMGRLAGYGVRNFSSQFVWTENSEVEVIGPLTAKIFSASSEYTGNLTFVETINGLDGAVNISGENGVSVSLDGNVIVINGGNPDFSPYATKVSLAATGELLGNRIAATGEGVQTQLNTLFGATGGFATVISLGATGAALVGSISSVSSNLGTTGSVLQGQISALQAESGSWATKSALAATGAALAGRVGTLEGQTGNYATNSAVSTASGVLSTRLIATGNGLSVRVSVLEGQSGSWATSANLQSTGATLQSQTTNLSSNTGNYVLKSQSGQFYPAINPSGFITSAALSPYALISSLVATGELLQGQITTLQDQTGSFISTGQTGVFASTASLAATGASAQNQLNTLFNATGLYALKSATGVLATAANLSLTGSTLAAQIASINAVRTTGAQTISGNKTFADTAFFNGGVSSDSLFTSFVVAVGGQGGLFDSNEIVSVDFHNRVLTDASSEPVANWQSKILSGDWLTNTAPTASGHLVNKGFFDARTGSLTGTFYPRYSNPSGYVTATQTGALNSVFVNSQQTGNLTGTFYPRSSNPSGYVRAAETGSFVNTTAFATATGSLTGAFYPLRSNPSGYVMASQTGQFASDAELNAATGALINVFVTRAETGFFGLSGNLNVVRTTGDQRILGQKNFEDLVVSGTIGPVEVFANQSRFDYYVFGTQAMLGAQRTLLDLNGNVSVAWSDRLLFDSLNAYSLDYSSRRLYDSLTLTSLNWENRTLTDSAALATVDWENSFLIHKGDGIPSVDWLGRGLVRSNSETGIAWESRTLSGNWITNTTPSESGHVVNKGHLNAYVSTGISAATGALTGIFQSPNLAFNSRTGAYTLSLADAGKVVEFTGNSSVILTVPNATGANFATGAQIIVSQFGSGVVSITGASGVTLHSRGNLFRTNGTFAQAALIKRTQNGWMLAGDLVL